MKRLPSSEITSMQFKVFPFIIFAVSRKKKKFFNEKQKREKPPKSCWKIIKKFDLIIKPAVLGKNKLWKEILRYLLSFKVIHLELLSGWFFLIFIRSLFNSFGWFSKTRFFKDTPHHPFIKKSSENLPPSTEL
jgi:hypothetical protein